ncbi:septum formation family protein [Actinomadura viridis]|uniref:DUF4190 domain-containing protein n=1 Tax=Actinomadura viridis TaxID=58110 RepID=UPI0036AF4FAC
MRDADTTNRFAIVALITGVLGIGPAGVGFGIAALVQIGRRGGRGKGMAIGGIATSVAWMVASVALVIALLPSLEEDAAENSAFHMYPKPGQCFDISGEDVVGTEVVPCDRPHDAEMVLYYELPKGPWPGDQEMDRRGTDGCEQRVRARFQTRAPVENGDTYALLPRRVTWALGDRKVYCAIAAFEGRKLTEPIGSRAVQTRTLDELRPGDCFTEPGRDSVTVTLIPCDRPHDAQLTHRFELPAGPYPGDAATEKKALAGCDARWEKMFGEHPSPVRIEQWYQHPNKESWGLGDRIVLCYVTDAKKRDLTRSVVPR